MNHKTRKLSMLLALVMVLSLFSAFATVASAAGATVTITPSATNVAVGDTVDVLVSVKNLASDDAVIVGLVSIDIPVFWNTEVLEYQGFEITKFPGDWDSTTNASDKAMGKMVVGGYDNSDTSTSFQKTDGFFEVKVTFKAIANGTSEIYADEIACADTEWTEHDFASETKTITVGSTATEPATASTVTITPSATEVAVGDTVDVLVSVKGLTNDPAVIVGLVSIDIPVFWNTEVLEYQSFEITKFPGDWDSTTNASDKAMGKMVVGGYDNSDTSTSFQKTDGFFEVKVTFKAIANGTSEIYADEIACADTEWTEHDFASETKTITVSGGTEPAPEVYYNVTFVAGANGTLSGTTTVSVLEGTDLSAVTFPTATANPGYKFVAWDKTSGAINAPTTVTASFEYDASQWFTVTYNLDGKGTTSDATSFGPFVTGTAWSATGIVAPTVTGTGVYSFTGWDKVAPATITADVVFTAQYQAAEGTKYITFKAGANGTILGYDDSNNLVANEIKRSLTAGEKVGAALATPAAIGNENYHFIGWYTDAGELYDFNSVVVDDVTLTAKFALNEFTVSEATVNGSDYVYTVTFNDGATINDAALANAKMYVFQQNTNGTTSASPVSNLKAVVIDNTITVTVASGSSVASIDLYFAYDTIDWASNDWNIIDIVIG